MSERAQTFFRIVSGKSPTLRDFMSYEELGIEPRRPLAPRDRDRWRGISVFNSFEAATSRQRESPLLGDHVAEVALPSESVFRVEQTGRNRSHHTIWADPADLLRSVTSVMAVEAVD